MQTVESVAKQLANRKIGRFYLSEHGALMAARKIVDEGIETRSAILSTIAYDYIAMALYYRDGNVLQAIEDAFPPGTEITLHDEGYICVACETHTRCPACDKPAVYYHFAPTKEAQS